MRDRISERSALCPGFARACLMLVPLLWLSATSPARAIVILNPFSLQPGSAGGDNYSVATYGGAGQANASFNPATGALASPGLGYGTLGANVGASQTDFGGIAAPTGNLAGGITTSATGATIPNAPFGSGNLAFGANNGGVGWSNFGVGDSAQDTNFSLSTSRGIATYSVLNNITGQAGVALGVQGLLPTGAQGFAALDATFTLRAAGGAILQQAEDAVVIAANNNGSGLANGVQALSINLANGVSQGAAGNGSSSGYSPSVDGSGNLGFTSFGVALLPSWNFVAGETLTIDATLTIAVDPMASFFIDPFPIDLTLPLIGAEGPAVGTPEPSSLVMSVMGLAIGLGYARRRI